MPKRSPVASKPVLSPSVQTAGKATTAALTPEERQSVLRTLRSPKLLKTEVLAGLVVALALIPEALAFSVIAGVDPRIGLFSAFTWRSPSPSWAAVRR